MPRIRVPAALEKASPPGPLIKPLSVTLALQVTVRLLVSVRGALIVKLFVEFDEICGRDPLPLVWKFNPLPASE